jgi:hypothetical protein
MIIYFAVSLAKITGYVACMGQIRNAYRILVVKAEGKRPLGIQRHRWEDNIKMYLRAVGWKVVNWMHLAQDRVMWRDFVNTVMNLRVQ